MNSFSTNSFYQEFMLSETNVSRMIRALKTVTQDSNLAYSTLEC
ncbi:MAG: hypothetical protein J7M10_09015 [Candidatus Cloacimonetes bacterium]|nr:hypothetical protein [Candidatus Cloacimonadota bacterium]